MTVELNDTVERYTISGVGPYAFNFRIFAETDLALSVGSSATPPVIADLTYLTHYTVSGVNDRDGGTVALTSGAAALYAGYTLDIRSNTPNEQPTNIRNIGRFLPEIHEDEFDRLTRQTQDLARKVRASLRYPDNALSDGELAPLANWLGRYVYINTLGSAEPAASIAQTTLSQSIIAGLLFPQTAAESSAGVTPTNYAYPAGDVRRYGVVGSGDETTKIQAAFNVAVVSGESVYFPDGADYGISAELTVTAKIRVQMAPGAKLKALAGFPNPATVEDASWMINASGAGVSGSEFLGVNLDGNGVAKGLRVHNAINVRVMFGDITDMRGPGVFFEDMMHASVCYVHFERCGVDPGGSTGVFTTTLRSQAALISPEHILFHGNTILDSGGKGIALAVNFRSIVSNNFVKDCVAAHGVAFYAAVCGYVDFVGNIGLSSVIGGAEVIKLSTNNAHVSARNNYFLLEIDRDICVLQDVANILLQGNTFRKTVATVTDRHHVRINDDATDSIDITIIGNNFVGHGITNTTAVVTPSTVDDVTVMGNVFRDFEFGVQVLGENPIVKGNAYRRVTRYEQLAGAANPQADYTALVLRTTADQATTGPGAGTLSLQLPAYRMDRTRGIRVRGSGTKTGGVGNKTIAFRFGTTDFTFNAAANDTNSWYFEAEVLNVSETSQRVQGVGFNGATALPFVGTAVEDTTLAINIGVRATPAAADTITLKMLTIELLP